MAVKPLVTLTNQLFPQAWYEANTAWTANTGTNRTSIASPSAIELDVGNKSFALSNATVLDCDTDAHWDTVSGTDYSVAAARAGKDFYVYACQSSALVPTLLLSANATYPSGYTAYNSRKIGGFHCLCLSAGTISGHPATGYLTGDIIPNSVWCLKHKSTSGSNVGMAFVEPLAAWVDIYLQSGTSTTTTSVFGGTITDTRMWNDHADDGYAVRKRLLRDAEFQIVAEGSNQQTNIVGSADPVTTGGHSDTASRRMISNYFLEDCCGAMWQWLDEQSYRVDGATWAWQNVVGGTKGQLYTQGTYGDVKLLAGGRWDHAGYCGSRCRNLSAYRWTVGSTLGGRLLAGSQER
jgi:hypothetical protein